MQVRLWVLYLITRATAFYSFWTYFYWQKIVLKNQILIHWLDLTVENIPEKSFPQLTNCSPSILWRL